MMPGDEKFRRRLLLLDRRSVHYRNYREAREDIAALLSSNRCRLNSVRISDNYVEVDFSSWSEEGMEQCLTLLEQKGRVMAARDLLESTHLDEDEAMLLAMELFNQQRFWEVHETVEDIWRKSTGSKKRALQGIIVYASSYVHFQKEEKEVALRMLERALTLLEGTGDRFMHFDIAFMRRKGLEMLSSREMRPFALP